MEQCEEDKPEPGSPPPAGQSYAATVALPSTPPSSTALLGTVVSITNSLSMQFVRGDIPVTPSLL